MPFNRRTFIKSSVSSGAAMLLPAIPTMASVKNQITMPAGFSIKIMATNWGFDGSADQFCGKVKEAGYDGIEVVWPADEAMRKLLFEAIKTQSMFALPISGDLKQPSACARDIAATAGAVPRDRRRGFKARLLQRGMSEAMAQANLDMWVAYDHGLDTAEPRTPQKTTPTSFRQWCEEVLKPRVMA